MRSKVIASYKKEVQEIYNKRFGVVFNGEDNQKPLVTENLIASSPTALLCCEIYASFLGGGGFQKDLSKVNLSENFWELITPDNLLFDACEQIAKHQGVFVQIAYNALYQKESYKIIPYTLCRVGKKDSNGYSGKIIVSSKGWGRSLKKDDVSVFDTYNPNPEVIQKQVENAGGWENYKGQIAFFSLQKNKVYPNSLIDSVGNFTDTENQIGYFYNSIVHRGFNDITVIRHKPFESEAEERTFTENASNVNGAQNAGSIWMIQERGNTDIETDKSFSFDKISGDQKPERYKHVEVSSSNYIRKAFKIPAQLVDFVQGKLGGSNGEDIKIWQAVYNNITARQRKAIEVFFTELFRDYKESINPDGNWTIKQYSLLSNGTVGEENEDGTKTPQKENYEEKLKKEAQATLRGSVGGVTGVLSIQTSVAQKVTAYDSGVAMLEEIFGYSTETAKRILGEPIELEKSDDTIND